jgi:hypothetical protein
MCQHHGRFAFVATYLDNGASRWGASGKSPKETNFVVHEETRDASDQIHGALDVRLHMVMLT